MTDTADLITLIRTQIANHPRSLQTRIGPSEVGTACSRRIGYRLAGVATVNAGDGWLPTIGTATHTWLADALKAENARLGRVRYLIETPISMILPGGSEVLSGSADCYDVDTGTVIDWKIVGKTTLEGAKRHGPSEQYRIQLSLYGFGLWLAGHEVKRIAVAFLPRNAPLRDAEISVEPFDPDIAARAVERLTNIRLAVDCFGAEALPTLPTAQSHCGFCPWHRFGSTDPTIACPGDQTHSLQLATLGGLVPQSKPSKEAKK